MSFTNGFAVRFFVFGAAAMQFIAPVFSSINEKSQSGGSDIQITPAPYTFVVWGAITLLTFAYGIYQLLPERENAELHRKLSFSLIAVYLLFSAWLFAAEREWLIVTLIIFVSMFAFLVKVFAEVLREKQYLTATEKLVLKTQLAIYTGWTTVAIFANLGSVLKFYGLSDSGTFGIFWQTCILLAALSNCLFWIRRFRADVFYVGTILWAFAGISAALFNQESVLVLQIVTCLAFLAVILWAIYNSANPNDNHLNLKQRLIRGN